MLQGNGFYDGDEIHLRRLDRWRDRCCLHRAAGYGWAWLDPRSDRRSVDSCAPGKTGRSVLQRAGTTHGRNCRQNDVWHAIDENKDRLQKDGPVNLSVCFGPHGVSASFLSEDLNRRFTQSPRMERVVGAFNLRAKSPFAEVWGFCPSGSRRFPQSPGNQMIVSDSSAAFDGPWQERIPAASPVTIAIFPCGVTVTD